MSPFSLHGQVTGSHGRKEERHGHRAQVWIGAKTEHPMDQSSCHEAVIDKWDER